MKLQVKRCCKPSDDEVFYAAHLVDFETAKYCPYCGKRVELE